MSRYKNPKRSVLFIFFIIIALVNLQFSATFAASIQENDNALLKKAETRYRQGEFDQTQQLIRQFLQTDSISKTDRIQAYILLSKTFIAKKKTDSAKEMVRKIFVLNPAYHPTLEQEKPSYVRLVDAVRNEMKPKKTKKATQTSKSNTLLWAGSGGAAALLIILGVLLSGDDSSKPQALPKPPDFPK